MTILYNASTSDGLRNFTRFLTNTNSTSFSDADVDAALNTYYGEVMHEILQAQDGWDFQGEYATTDLVANQQEYTLPSDIIKIKRAEITFDGTTWRPLTFMDINERGDALDSTTIASDFTTSKPFADLMDESLFLYPIPSSAVTGGLKIWYSKDVTDLSAATDSPVFADRYHKILAYGAAKDYFEKYLEVPGNDSKQVKARANYNNLLDEMREYYNTRNQDRDYILKTTNEYNEEYGINNI